MISYLIYIPLSTHRNYSNLYKEKKTTFDLLMLELGAALSVIKLE